MYLLPLMKSQTVWFARFNFLLVLVLFSVALTGCKTADYSAAMEAPTGTDTNTVLPPLKVGDTVTISFAGIEDLTPQEKPIKDDGSITLPDIGRVQAAGKTAGELEDAIHDLYVPKIYKHLNVTVKTSNQLTFFVRGEVKSPNAIQYYGPTTVTKAITAAGDFSDFANRKKVILTRANGQRFRLNCVKILDGEPPDPPVYPGDQIEVKKRLW